jgi:hypothetical protein
MLFCSNDRVEETFDKLDGTFRKIFVKTDDTTRLNIERTCDRIGRTRHNQDSENRNYTK